MKNFYEGAWIPHLLDESCDFNADFYDLIYQLRHDDRSATIDEFYRRVRALICRVIREGLMAMVKVTYRSKNRIESQLVSQRALSLEEAMQQIDDPWIWQSANTHTSPHFTLSTTSSGETYIEALTK